MHSTAELQQLQRAGKAHRLASGAIIATGNPAEVASAISQAKAAKGTGGDDDDPAFRAHLIGRAAACGLQRLVPASWAAEQRQGAAGKSRGWDGDRVDRELADAVTGVLKAASCQLILAEIGYVTPPERAEAVRKAAEYRVYAAHAVDRETHDMWLAAASEKLRKAGIE